MLADVQPSSAIAIAGGLICVFGVLPFPGVLIPMPVVQFMGWSML